MAKNGNTAERPEIAPAVERMLGRPTEGWTSLDGGRSNAIWRVSAGGERLVCKLYRSARASTLFPNLATAEILALDALAGTALAPRLVGRFDSDGATGVVYHYVEGARVPVSEAFCRGVGAALRRLHARPVPEGLRSVSLAGVTAQVAEIVEDLPASVKSEVARRRPVGVPPASARLAFLHGDPVPANVVIGPDGPVLIDWQCPAAGDPIEDAFVFLSPAMQALYGDGPLPEAARVAFWRGYDDADVWNRYAAAVPWLHWRMYGYCLAMAARGESDYRAAAELERAALEQLDQSDDAT